MGGSARRVNCTNREFIAVHTCCLVFTIFRNHMRLKERTKKKELKKRKLKKTCIKEGKCKKIKEKKREKRKYRKIIKQKQKNYNM